MDPYGNVDLSRVTFDFHAFSKHVSLGENFDSCFTLCAYSGRNEALSVYLGDAYTLSDALTSIVMEICPSLCMVLECVSLGLPEIDA